MSDEQRSGEQNADFGEFGPDVTELDTAKAADGATKALPEDGGDQASGKGSGQAEDVILDEFPNIQKNMPEGLQDFENSQTLMLPKIDGINTSQFNATIEPGTENLGTIDQINSTGQKRKSFKQNQPDTFVVQKKPDPNEEFNLQVDKPDKKTDAAMKKTKRFKIAPESQTKVKPNKDDKNAQSHIDSDEELDLHLDSNQRQFEDFEFTDDSDEATDLISGAMSMMKKGGKMLNPINVAGNLKNAASGIQNIGGKGLDGIMKIGTMFDKETSQAQETKLETALENKQAYLQKYGLEFEVPSEYIQKSIFYPKDPKYILQLINYVVPENKPEFMVETHFLDKERGPERMPFTELYANMITGCALRLVKTNEKLTVLTKYETYFFDEKDVNGDQLRNIDISFSPNGKYLVISSIVREHIFMYEIVDKDVEGLLDNIRSNNYVAKIELPQEELSDREPQLEISYGNQGNYFIAIGVNRLVVFQIPAIISSQQDYKPEIFDLNREEFSRIWDVYFESFEDLSFKCYVAAQYTDKKKIKVFEIRQVTDLEYMESDENVINFFNKVSDDFTIRFTNKNEKLIVVLANGQENFTISESEEIENMFIQKNLVQLGDKQIEFISSIFDFDRNENEGFYIVACKDYDEYLHVFKSNDNSYHYRIPRIIQPGSVEVFDIHFDDGVLKVLSLIDDEFYIDQVNVDKINERTQNMSELEISKDEVNPLASMEYAKRDELLTLMDASASAFSVGWPYITFTGLKNYLLIFNVYQQNILHRIQLAEDHESVQVRDTYITTTKDLFFILRNDDRYIVYTLDLDNLNTFEKKVDPKRPIVKNEDLYDFEKVFEYTAEEVEFMPLDDMFVRGSSRKEVIQLNEKLIIFILHRGTLYQWTEGYKGRDGKMLLKVCNDPRLSILSRELVRLDDRHFFFCQKSIDNLESISEVVKITVKYNDYDTNIIARENCDLFDYLDFKIDGQNMMLLLVLNKITSDNEGDPVYLKIIKMNEGNKCIFDEDIHDEDLKGVLKSGFYTLVDGHIYFRNQVIKMRYELMAEYRVSEFDTCDVFNKYPDVLQLKDNDKVKTKSPLNSIQSHRFAYVILNSKDLYPKRVMMMPYLHERKIYLNRIKKNTQYFYTSILHESEIQEVKHDELNIAQSEGVMTKKKKVHHHDFVAVNLSESKYYFYTEKGILQFRVDFSDITKQKGNIVSVSPNGLNFVFQIPGEKTIDIFRLAYNKMLHIKTIHIDKAINLFVKDQNIDNEEYRKLRSKKNPHWLYGPSNLIQYNFKINNNCDICIQLKLQQNKHAVSLSKSVTMRYNDFADTMYFFQSGYKMEKKTQSKIVDKDDILVIKKMFKDTYKKMSDFQSLLQDPDDWTLKGENLIISQDYAYHKYEFSMDGDRIFFWTDHEIEYYDLKRAFKPSNKKVIALQIDKDNKNSKIKTVEPGDEQDEIAIIVDQVDGSLVFSWSIKNNLEYQVFEVQKQHEILWDHDGKFIITTPDVTTIPIVGCRLKCFKPDNFESRNQIIQNKELGFQNGYRFDSKNHNWMLMYQYLCISHSYMTFVIQQEIENISPAAEISEEKLLSTAFDAEAFNYLYNRNHVFMRGDLVKSKFNQFDAILKKLNEIDPFFIQILHYNTDVEKENLKKDSMFLVSAIGDGLSAIDDLVRHKDEDIVEKNSALHYAHKIGNNRTVDIILSNMADIDENNSEHYCSVMPEMIDIKSFTKYIERLCVRTRQMLDKNILRIETPLNDSIIAIESSPTLFVDDIFYREKFKEEKTNVEFKAYPVEVLALKIDWIISTKQGKEFLQALNQSENLDFFDIKTLQVIIEFLYSRSKVIMLYIFLPLYLVQFGFFLMTMVLTELHVKEGRGIKYMSSENLNILRWIIVLGNQIFTFIMVSIMVQQGMHLGTKYLTRVYTWSDIAFYTFNTITNALVIKNENELVRYQRILCSFSMICFLVKTFYYLKLVDQIAPIIDIIIRIIFDIKWFLLVFVLSIAAFSISFFLLGNNQIDYDIADEECPEGEDCSTLDLRGAALGISYAQLKPAFWFGWYLTNGGEPETFDIGEGSQSVYLYGIYVGFQFLMQIHLLNMLIAYMGETFSTNNEKGEQIKVKDHLSFVLDNWYLKEFSLGNVKNIKYIIAALPVQDAEEDDGIGQLQAQLDEIKLQIKKQSIENSKRAVQLEESMKLVLYTQEKILHKFCK